MAVQSFYVSIELSTEEKQIIQTIVSMPHYKKTDDLIFKNTLFIENIDLSEKDLFDIQLIIEKHRNQVLKNGFETIDGIDDTKSPCHWWHIHAGLYDLFHNLEKLYELLQIVESVKKGFVFILLGEKHPFNFESFLDFLEYVFPKIKPYKDVLETRFGVFSVHPQLFFKVRKKNKKYFI